jgi:hypothetical protein
MKQAGIKKIHEEGVLGHLHQKHKREDIKQMHSI